jgi:hypothetical protein
VFSVASFSASGTFGNWWKLSSIFSYRANIRRFLLQKELAEGQGCEVVITSNASTCTNIFLTMASGKEVEEFFSSWLNVSAPMYTKQSRGNELWQSATQKILY